MVGWRGGWRGMGIDAGQNDQGGDDAGNPSSSSKPSDNLDDYLFGDLPEDFFFEGLGEEMKNAGLGDMFTDVSMDSVFDATPANETTKFIARSMSYSYGIVYQVLRGIIIVNGGPGDQVDVVVNIRWIPEVGESIEISNYYQGIEFELFDDGPPYRIDRMVFTVNDGLISARYFYLDKRGQPVDFVADERNHQSAIYVAKLVMWCDCVLNDLPKAIQLSVETTKLGKEDEHDSCVICHETYRAEDMMGKLVCDHSFHEECIKSWLMKKTKCPLCRGDALCFDMD
ncbi:hypothetical protein R6Q59_023223 [Mikania micrantha]